MQDSAGSSGLSRLNGLGDRHTGDDAHGECGGEGIPGSDGIHRCRLLDRISAA
jgi:hypothetical protein